MSSIFTFLCLWVAGMVSGFWLSGIIAHSSSPAKKEQRMVHYCVALFMPLLCVGALVLFLALFAELMSQISLPDTAKSIVDYALSLITEAQ